MIDILKLKPTLDEIISLAIRFSIDDLRREQIWSLIIKDETLIKQLVKRLKNDANLR
jgi:hypothetical protein